MRPCSMSVSKKAASAFVPIPPARLWRGAETRGRDRDTRRISKKGGTLERTLATEFEIKNIRHLDVDDSKEALILLRA